MSSSGGVHEKVGSENAVRDEATRGENGSGDMHCDEDVVKQTEQAEKVGETDEKEKDGEKAETAVVGVKEKDADKKEEVMVKSGDSGDSVLVRKSPQKKQLAPLKPTKSSTKLAPLKPLKRNVDESPAKTISSIEDAPSSAVNGTPATATRTSPLPRRSLKKYQVAEPEEDLPDAKTESSPKAGKEATKNEKTDPTQTSKESTTEKNTSTATKKKTEAETSLAQAAPDRPDSSTKETPAELKASILERDSTAATNSSESGAAETSTTSLSLSKTEAAGRAESTQAISSTSAFGDGDGRGGGADTGSVAVSSESSSATSASEAACKVMKTADCIGRHPHLGHVDWDAWDTVVEEALQASTSTGVGTKAGGHSSNTKLQSGGSGDIVVVLFAVPWSPTSLYVAESLDEARACGELAKVAMFIVNSDSCADKAWELGVESPLPTLIVYSGGAPLRWRRPTRETSIRLDHGITRRNVTSVLRCAFDATRAGKTVASLGF